VTVPADELAGVGVRANLRGNDRIFVELTFTPLTGSVTALAIACHLANDLIDWTGLLGDGADPVESDHAASPATARLVQDPTDPLDITQPHGHDLTLDQATVLYEAFGYLLAMAHSRSAA
jgi:hypothetical protein